MKRGVAQVSIGVAVLLGATRLAAQTGMVITAFSGNGDLSFNPLAGADNYAVEWASTASGPWTNTWAGLEFISATQAETVTVQVPMLYRVVARSATLSILHLDESLDDETARLWTSSGGVAFDTTDRVFGTASLRVGHQSGARIYHSGTALGAGDFTVEGFAKADAFGELTQGTTLFDCRNGDLDNSGFSFYLRYQGTLAYGRGNPFTVTVGTTPLVAGRWYYMALVRRNGVVTGYLGDMTENPPVARKEFAVADTLNFSRTTWYCGMNAAGAISPGRIDEVRIARTARYVGEEYPAPSLPFVLMEP